LLRTRGGISYFAAAFFIAWGSSPHTRRYFPGFRPIRRRRDLFSAHAEVFPSSAYWDLVSFSLLRTRGGISKRLSLHVESRASSPHTRRYFLRRTRSGLLTNLFSAHAEVFP